MKRDLRCIPGCSDHVCPQRTKSARTVTGTTESDWKPCCHRDSARTSGVTFGFGRHNGISLQRTSLNWFERLSSRVSPATAASKWRCLRHTGASCWRHVGRCLGLVRTYTGVTPVHNKILRLDMRAGRLGMSLLFVFEGGCLPQRIQL